MINVTNNDITPDYKSLTMTSGKHTAEIAVWKDGSVMVSHKNANRTGKNFCSFAEALNAYKSTDMKAMISFMESND